jgi:DnaJ-class molecular chaperone
MGKNYYKLLGVPKDAPASEISARFRLLAITYHPEKNTDNMAQANFIFSEVCEAFEVLINGKTMVVSNS